MTEHRKRTMQLADYVRELTLPHPQAEHYTVRVAGKWEGRDHNSRAPALVTQLWVNDIPSGTAEEGARPGFQSKPAARLDAHDTGIRIDLEAARWVRDLGEDDPGVELEVVRQERGPEGPTCEQCQHRSCTAIRRGVTYVRRAIPGSGTIACIRLLHGLSASADPVTRRAIERDVRRWWTQARIVTGWDAPAWTPDNTCPQCGERGTLKVRLADRIGMCTNDPCRVTWDEQTIGLLADHIRRESDEERQPRTGAGPCWCPYPKPIVPDLSRLCRSCGSARCRHALGQRLLDTLRGQVGA